MSAMGGRFDGQTALDLFSGSGALGLEMLSRGAERVTLVEQARPALAAIRDNVDKLGCAEAVTVVAGDVFGYLDRLEGIEFDLAVADPPYQRGLAERLVRQFRKRPFAEELWVEHRSGELTDTAPVARQRRYGDTVLSTLAARESV